MWSMLYDICMVSVGAELYQLRLGVQLVMGSYSSMGRPCRAVLLSNSPRVPGSMPKAQIVW